MGLLYLAINIPKAITITFFLNIISHIRFIFIGALTQLGLFKPAPEEDSNSTNNSNNYILILDASSPSLVPIPVHVVTAAIKSRLPILPYLPESESIVESEESGVQKVCTICLECVELNEEIRVLCNCTHLFHRVCLDTWIDQGQVTCPLCRSMLLPPRTNLTRCNPILNC
ncbi:hypothetical protein ABFX02_01G107300 [Erythranthe guttata]